METAHKLSESRLADAWATLQSLSDKGASLSPQASRIAFADPEFLTRRETRGMRMQLEMLKSDLGQAALGVENTIVVFGSARFCGPDEAAAKLAAAQAAGDAAATTQAQRLVRNAP